MDTLVAYSRRRLLMDSFKASPDQPSKIELAAAMQAWRVAAQEYSSEVHRVYLGGQSNPARLAALADEVELKWKRCDEITALLLTK